MELTFNKSSAESADRGSLITTSGVYTGILTKAEVFKKASGAAGIEFAFESEDGSKADFLSIYTRKKTGEESFGMGHIHALMGILGLSKVNTQSDGDRTIIPAFCQKKIAVALQREDYLKNNGTVGYKMNILHFFDAVTKKTYAELSSGKEAKTYLREIKDKPLNENQTVSNSPNMEEDLPF
jgi:hypothetical protein